MKKLTWVILITGIIIGYLICPGCVISKTRVIEVNDTIKIK